MDIERIRQLMKLVRENEVGELIVEEAGSRIVIRMPYMEHGSRSEGIASAHMTNEETEPCSLTPDVPDALDSSTIESGAADFDDRKDESISLAGLDALCDEDANDANQDLLIDGAVDVDPSSELVEKGEGESASFSDDSLLNSDEGIHPAALLPAGPRESWVPVLSPVVGTFHASAAPGLEPFVVSGMAVGAGKALGIVKALNIGNRIKTKFPAVVREICVRDGDSVQNGTVLFYLEPVDEILQATLGNE